MSHASGLGQLPLRAQTIDLSELVDRVTQRIREQLQRGYELLVDLQPSPCSIEADPDRLEQVLTKCWRTLSNTRQTAALSGSRSGGCRPRAAHRSR